MVTRKLRNSDNANIYTNLASQKKLLKAINNISIKKVTALKSNISIKKKSQHGRIKPPFSRYCISKTVDICKMSLTSAKPAFYINLPMSFQSFQVVSLVHIS